MQPLYTLPNTSRTLFLISCHMGNGRRNRSLARHHLHRANPYKSARSSRPRTPTTLHHTTLTQDHPSWFLELAVSKIARSMAAEGNAAAARRPSSSAAAGRGCGVALGRLVRKLRRQSRMLCAATAAGGSSAAARCQQYDPLSYARNFDFGTALDGDAGGGHSFAARFVLAASAARRQPQ
ncbi:hypothetical protein ACP4OV_013577 [Aristida adscensionis]